MGNGDIPIRFKTVIELDESVVPDASFVSFHKPM